MLLYSYLSGAPFTYRRFALFDNMIVTKVENLISGIHHFAKEDDGDWFHHREKGPAIIYFYDPEAKCDYYYRGKLHRLDGPACVYHLGPDHWCVDGEFICTSEGALKLPDLLKFVAAVKRWKDS
jgi:hypothetical protein